MKYTETCKGVTLVELCTVLAIMAIITLSAVSFAPSIIQKHRADSVTRELLHLFNLARTEAITSGSIVTLCPTNKTGNCSGDWKNNPISVFIDPDNSRSVTNTETVIKLVAPPSTGALKSTPKKRGYFQFGALGSSRGTPGNLTYSPKTNDPTFARKIIISFSGRARLASVKKQ
ncbi:GspH/FimT family pseudopilin [Marinobacter sp. S6332]|uniref:GspH/FimT family pseudopilin n=1 Tax=Marinobacter sp. S6332 TaxID=2926403 RepID=UPI001FF661DF|nr:GspH/FimT family pseudopilin [Marinobacter sp. S6332]MCK0164998.1 GspH/FimT family pseudopilin [Marinobacter sp. S6332]